MIVLVLGVFLVSAENNETNSTGSQNDTVVNDTTVGDNETGTSENSTLECEEDSDCGSGYECEDSVCVVDDEENETDSDDNETDSDDEDEEEDENKVCCFRYRIKQGEKIEGKYNRINEKDCLEYEDEDGKFSEIVNDTQCNRYEFKYEIKEKQRIKFEAKTNQTCPEGCECEGVVMKCELEGGGREMRVFAGNSGNIIIQVKGVNVSTNVSIYKDENGTLIGNFSGGVRKIGVLPDEVKFKVKEKVKAKLSEEEIELEAEGEYEYTANKESRFLGLFKIRERIHAQIDSETGDVRVNAPWWGFLANDVEEE